ncbi:MAG TPA: hypothetical protein V6C85_31270 [Allocoleopsis sp.]
MNFLSRDGEQDVSTTSIESSSDLRSLSRPLAIAGGESILLLLP